MPTLIRSGSQQKDVTITWRDVFQFRRRYLWPPNFWPIALKDPGTLDSSCSYWINDDSVFLTRPPRVCSPQQLLWAGLSVNCCIALPRGGPLFDWYCFDTCNALEMLSLKASVSLCSRDASPGSTYCPYHLLSCYITFCFPLIARASRPQCFAKVILAF